MNGRSSSSPRPRSATATSSRPASASKTLLNDHYIHRIAIDPSAGLGSFYDARTECVVGKLSLDKKLITKTAQHEKVDCFIMKDDTFDTENLFRKIGIHDELWLNSILNSKPSHGIASVVNYSFPKTTNTRFLYYYYISEEQWIPTSPNIVRVYIPKDIPNITATHIISARRVGIQALIVLQLPLNNETDLDCLLENIAQQLIQNRFEPRREEKSLSERIIVTKIFSNIPDLNKMSTFAVICQKITAMKPHIYRHYPIEFTLRTIQWFYPLYPTEKTKYIPVEPEIVKKIKNHLLSLSSKIEELKTSLNPEDKQTVDERRSKQYDALQQQITNAEKMYSVDIERIRDLVIKIRSGAMKQEPIDEILSNITEQSFQNNINLIESRPQALRDREQQIHKSDKQNTKYVDKHQLSNQQPIDTNEQSKPVNLSAPSTSQVTLEPNKKSKEIEGPSHLSLSSKKSSAENAPSRADSLNGVEQPPNLLTIPTSQPSLLKEEESTDIGRKSDHLRSEKTSTRHRKAPLNQETTHETEQCNESKPTRMSGPPVSPRSQRQGSNSNEPIRPTTPLKSSNLVTSPSKLSSKIEKPVSRTTSPDRSVTEGTTLQEKQRIEVEEQQKPTKSPTLAMSNRSLASSQQTKGYRESSDTSIPPTQLDTENTLPRSDHHVSLEAATSQSKPLTSQSPPVPIRRGSTKTEHQPDPTEPSNSSTTANATISNQQSNNGEELSNTPNSRRILTPQTERKDINDEEPFKPSPTRRSSASEKQPDYPGEHNTVPDSSSKLAFDATQPPKERPKNSNKQRRPSSSPTSSNKQSENIGQSFNPSIPPNLLDGREMSSQDNQHVHSNKQHTSRPSSTQSASRISFTLDQENEENNKLFHSSILSKQSDVKNSSSQTLQLTPVEDPSNGSRPSTPSNQAPSARTRRQIRKTDEQLNMTVLSNNQINHEKELSDPSHVPMILTPRATSQAKQESTDNQEFLHNEASVQSSTMNRTSSSIEPSKGLNDQVSSATSTPILSAETSQRTEEQFKDTEEQANQLESSQPFVTEHASSLEQQPNDVKQETDIQKSPRPATPNPALTEKRPGSSTHSSSNKYINILLLGESGVGKSTFINALLNYHAFNTFEEARSNQPFVAMPVSFLMTVGDQFEEKIVRFGGVDPNEDHDHPGQSVTQHCRSYVFQIGTQTKLRIIDTPGMGDTRGLEQDDRNMQHIVSFINNLPDLNAICILLKPNESRLTIAFRSYFTRLLNFLGENARNNIVFCFTNTRATFFAPGSTGPLLKEMIKNLPIKDIPFAKTNTFCFDSEAFRYLVALQNQIKFDIYQENEYEQSWASSSTVSNRLLEYICAELKPYSQKKWQSIEHAQFQINQLIRPMLETMRNLFRNITLLKEKPSKPLIKLCPTVLSQPAAICYACPRLPERFRDFWILPDDLHAFADKCHDCDHSKKKHIHIDYKLEYELIQYEGAESFEKMNSNLDRLRVAMLEFSQFYGYVVDTLKQNDPMLSALKRIIAEESQICSEKDSTCLNSTLRGIFLALKKEYQDRRKTIISVHVPVDLPSLYELIQNISEMDEISEQMDKIKKAQKRYLKQHEKQVS